ncbi:MAG: response regulator transcription factor, partial [Erysipelotrichaceae bacterium]|nr:response regulator transcription factor [Erysipelotrichaceae bacterium]
MYKIMIVEDDEIIAKTIQQHLETWNYEVMIIDDFEHVLESFMKYQPHLILLDITLPYYNGYYWCQQIRNKSEVPIIFISSVSENMSIVMAMNMGGDDFINKPFDLNILTSKVQAIMRRTYTFSKQLSILSYKNLILNLLDATLSYHNISIELTRNELKIMQLLINKHETYVSRDELMMALWQSDQFIDDNTLSVNMNRLRKKLEILNIQNLITTKKGLGYMLAY